METVIVRPRILGVCSWLATKSNVDVLWIRLAFVAAAVFGIGFPVLLYILLYFVVDKNESTYDYHLASSSSRGKFLGVSAWLADKYNIDVTLIRMTFILLTLMGFGLPAILYLVLYFVKD